MDRTDADSAGVDPAGTVFDIDTFAVHDGPGIRMAVYLRGCPLACAWCHSPDSQQSLPEVILMRDRCTLCGECVSACIHDRHEVREGAHVFERHDCAVCGDCVRSCPAGALAVRGRSMSAAEVVARAERMVPFFRYSGGGVTLTGGEATGQADFAFAILDGCRRLGIHTPSRPAAPARPTHWRDCVRSRTWWFTTSNLSTRTRIGDGQASATGGSWRTCEFAWGDGARSSRCWAANNRTITFGDRGRHAV